MRRVLESEEITSTKVPRGNEHVVFQGPKKKKKTKNKKMFI